MSSRAIKSIYLIFIFTILFSSNIFSKTIKVIVAYTAAAKTGAQTYNGGINTLINDSILNTSLCHSNSNTGHSFSLAHSYETNYVESGFVDTDLYRFRVKNDGYIDEIHQKREQYDADICVLICETFDLTNGKAAAFGAKYDKAFCVVRRRACVGSTYSFAHETGHLLGGAHQGGGNTQYNNAKAYSWQGSFDGKSGKLQTLMGADGFPRVRYFSSPNITDDSGNPIGDATHNNAYVVAVTGNKIADFHPISATISGPTALEQNEDAVFNCQATGGNPDYTYQWEYKKTLWSRAIPGNIWYQIGTNSSQLTIQAPNNGDYRPTTVRCFVKSKLNGQLLKLIISQEHTFYYDGGQKNILNEDLLSPNTFSESSKPVEKILIQNKSSNPETGLLGNYPNPFNPTTTIKYYLEKASDVKLAIFNIQGEQVYKCPTKFQAAGIHQFKFQGNNLASGIYFCRMRVNGKIYTRKMFLLK